MTSLFDEENHATPLAPEERCGLIPTHVTLRRELNELEQRNILEGEEWAFQRKRNVLNEKFLCRLHARLFGDVWKWAGQYRTSSRNLGVESWKIQPELYQTIQDVAYWIENKTYAPDEIAVRFHHRLVLVHPFPNGNGRWSRLAADLLIVKLGSSRFSWGCSNLQAIGAARKRYIDALHAADAYDLSPLVLFARS